MSIPVVIFIYKRSSNIVKLLQTIAKVKPNNLYIIADGPKNSYESTICSEVRDKVESCIDWKCKVRKIYAKSNMGIKNRVVSGLNEVFKNEKWAIILEDDLLPDPSFFEFCEKLLRKYENDHRIISISGNKFYNSDIHPYSYTFSKYPHSWGWATWRRVWVDYEKDIETWDSPVNLKKISQALPRKISRLYWFNIFAKLESHSKNIWDYQLTFLSLSNNSLNIVPSVNLVKNVGNDKYATHTKGKNSRIGLTTRPMIFPLTHPKNIHVNKNITRETEEKCYLNFTIKASLILRYLLKKITVK